MSRGARDAIDIVHTATSDTTAHRPPGDNMAWIPGGTFLMGSNDHYPEEAPAHRGSVNAFWMDRHAVTNAEFRRFVDATGYVTLAEKLANPEEQAMTDRAALCGLFVLLT
jgi:formylglycine-generating enzyme required for sulfatase activity